MDRLEKRLVAVARELPEDARQQLLAFAEFLLARQERPPIPAEPLPIARPAGESVVRAIRRLSATYPMLDRAQMLNETSALMTQHVLEGRPSAEVVDELEALFRAHFDRLRRG